MDLRRGLGKTRWFVFIVISGWVLTVFFPFGIADALTDPRYSNKGRKPPVTTTRITKPAPRPPATTPTPRPPATPTPRLAPAPTPGRVPAAPTPPPPAKTSSSTIKNREAVAPPQPIKVEKRVLTKPAAVVQKPAVAVPAARPATARPAAVAQPPPAGATVRPAPSPAPAPAPKPPQQAAPAIPPSLVPKPTPTSQPHPPAPARPPVGAVMTPQPTETPKWGGVVGFTTDQGWSSGNDRMGDTAKTNQLCGEKVPAKQCKKNEDCEVARGYTGICQVVWWGYAATKNCVPASCSGDVSLPVKDDRIIEIQKQREREEAQRAKEQAKQEKEQATKHQEEIRKAQERIKAIQRKYRDAATGGANAYVSPKNK